MRNHATTLVLIALCGVAEAQPGLQPPEDMTPPPRTQQPPPGSTHATFISATGVKWDVLLDQQLACETPCTTWVIPLQFVELHSREDRPAHLDVGYLNGGDVMVTAEPMSQGLFAAGITFTTLTGLGLAAGITLTAVGCSTDRTTMCHAGIITAIPTAIGLYGSILMIRAALPKAHLGPASPYVTGSQVGLAGTF